MLIIFLISQFIFSKLEKAKWRFSKVFCSDCCCVSQVSALRRQVRPISGKVTRKGNLPETSQDLSHRASRTYSASGAPTGARYIIQAPCAFICVQYVSSFCSDGKLFALDYTIAGRLGCTLHEWLVGNGSVWNAVSPILSCSA